MLDNERFFCLSTQDHPGGFDLVEISKDFDVSLTISSMEEVTKKIIAMKNHPHFSVDTSKGKPTFVLDDDEGLHTKIISFLRLPEREVRKFLVRRKLHTLVSILTNKLLDEELFGFDEADFDFSIDLRKREYRLYAYQRKNHPRAILNARSEGMSKYCEKLNKVVRELREETSAKGEALSRNFTRGAQQNLKSLKDLFKNLLSIKSRILVVRVDLLYREAFGVEEYGSEKTYQQVIADRACLIKEIQKNHSDGLLGYAWKLEYGASRGYHYHMVFFFDGALHHQDIRIGMLIGSIWCSKTEMRGTFHNCNANKDKYRICGLGMFNHSDSDLEERFDAMAGYLTKADYHGRLILPGRQRSFQTTFCKKKKGTKGRPRRSSNLA